MSSSALFRRAARYAATPAGAAFAAAGASSYFGQRGSATVTARTSSAVVSRCSSTTICAPGGSTPLGAAGIGYGNGGLLASFGRQMQRRTLSTSAEGTAKASATAAAKPAADKVVVEEAAAKTEAASGGSRGGGGFLAWYESHLQSNPVPTKMVTGGILWGLGDVVAQVVPVVTHPDSDEATNFKFDPARLARASAFGFAIHAPIAHLHYNFLEWMTVRSGITGGIKVPVFKAFMEQFVYWSWFSNSLYHGAMGAMQGWSARQCYDRIADVLWDTQKAQWAFWIPVQLVNFRYVPVRHQLNVVLLTSVVWTALLSAWYPPEREEERERKELIK